ncbi:MAG TPA: hypothetical protein DHV70_00120 [Firmicutes bacterium]|jgi:hypothetical protein|nr:hypothetical protein [Bacillota bacterium]
MKQELLNDELVKYLTSSFPDLVNDSYEDNQRSYPYLDCVNSFYEKLYNEYGIKFNPELMGDDLRLKLDEEIVNCITK